MEFKDAMIISVGLFLVLAVASGLGDGGGTARKTDGVYESATRKIDRGQTLTPAEQQRIHDIINWDESKQKYNIK